METRFPSVSPSLDSLRDEASHLKDCYTRFSAQAIGICAVANALILKLIWDTPEVGVISIFVMLLAFTAARIGTFKYGGANRLHGYELHLARVRHVEDCSTNGWRSHMTDIGWEEALRAWRIVHATMYKHVYYTAPSGPEHLNLDMKNANYKWFEPSRLIHRDSHYHPGTYLEKTFDILFLTAIISYAFLVLMTVLLFAGPNSNMWAGLGSAFVTVPMFMVLKARISRLEARRVILEHGLLSIHSCAVTWQAVVVAHYRALQMLRDNGNSTYRDYSFAISLQANDIIKNFEKIHEWVLDFDQPEVMETWNSEPAVRDRLRNDVAKEPRSLQQLLLKDLKYALWGIGVRLSLQQMLGKFRCRWHTTPRT